MTDITKIESPTKPTVIVSKINELIDGKQEVLVSGTNIKTVNNTSILGEGNISINTEASVDQETIDYNNSDELQALGVINPQTDTSIRIWEGTSAEYESGGGSQTWYNWQNGTITHTWSSVTLSLAPTSNAIYGNNKFITFGTNNSATVVMISTDGITWNSTDVSANITDEIVSVAFGNDTFVAIGGENAYYSSDGMTWTKVPLTSATYLKIFYGGGQFMIIASDGTILYSSDGTSWTTATSPSVTMNYVNYAYGNGKHFISVTYTSSTSTYLISTDGINWTQQDIDIGGISKIVYNNNNNIFYAYAGGRLNGVSYYSSDLMNWQLIENSALRSGFIRSIIYMDKFYALINQENSTVFISSTDFVSWQIENMPSNLTSFSARKEYLTADVDDNILVISNDTNSGFMESSGTILNIYTTDSVPTTSSQVYSAPNTTSALTITAVGTGTITLSDTNTYNYNASGNQTVTQTVGEAHPDWICNIENVALKKGSIIIAEKNGEASEAYTATEVETMWDSI